MARRHRVRRRLALFLAPFVVIVLLPYAIAPFYRFIDPVSTPMLWRGLTGRGSSRSRAAQPHRAGTAACRHRRRGRQLLPQSRHRSRRHAGGLGAVRRKPANPAAPRPSPSRRPRTCSCGRAAASSAKALEIPLALWLNLVLPKRRILEIYLNIAEWGPNGEFGAEAGRALGLRQIGSRTRPPRGGGIGRDPAQSDAAQRPHARLYRAQAGRAFMSAGRRPMATLDACVRVACSRPSARP